MTIEEFEVIFGKTSHRLKLISGLKLGMSELKNCGCKRVFVDGSFTTNKEVPGDFDACWDITGADLNKIQSEYPTLLDFFEDRKNQKAKYYGEFFPAQVKADPYNLYIEFFQKDRDGNPKGIIQLDLI